MDWNDPLNWTNWQKYRTYFIVCFFAFLSVANASKFTLATSILQREFNKSPMVVGYLTCFNVLAEGVGTLFWVPLMRIIGKRPILLLALPILVAANVWSSKTNDFDKLLAASVCSGFAASAAEAPTVAVVADLFFVHERGAKLMIFHLALSCGIFLGPLINAFVIEHSTWRVACESLAIAAGALWVVALCFFQETTYRNRDVYAPLSSYGARKTFLRKMCITSGFDEHQNILHAFCNCITITSYPSVLWAGLLAGTFSGWNIIVQLRSYQAFAKPPYSNDIPFLGLFSLSGFIGGVLAIPFGGFLLDMLSTRITSIHNGYREPEYRLYALVVPTIIGPMGVLLFGLTIAEKRPWIQPAIGFAMQSFGLTAISNIIITNVVDTYLHSAGEVMVPVSVFKGVIGAVVVLYGDNWIRIAGEKQAFGEMVGVQYFLCVWVIVFLVWGKRIRAFTVRYGPVLRADYAR